MTENNVSQLPERRGPEGVSEASALPAVTAPPSPAEWQAMKQQAQVIARSGMAPKSVNTPEKVLVIALKGRELSIPPMQALSHIHIVEGKPTLSAELMAALVHRAGHKLRIIDSSATGCTVEGVRRDDPNHPERFTFGEDDAKRAGVLNRRGPWQTYPQAMYRARAISQLCRTTFADVLMGASYTPEELGAEVDEEGQVVDSFAEPVHEQMVEREPEGEVEEAEVVDEGPASLREEPSEAADFEHGGILPAQLARIETLSEWIWGQKRAVEESPLLKGHKIEELTPDSAKKVIAGLQKTKERMQATEQPTEQPSEEVAIADDVEPEQAPHPDEVEGVERGGAANRQDAGELPATRKQLSYLEALVADVVEDGVAKFEDMVGKPIGELTREEASEWISRLSGRQA